MGTLAVILGVIVGACIGVGWGVATTLAIWAALFGYGFWEGFAHVRKLQRWEREYWEAQAAGAQAKAHGGAGR